VPLQARRIEHRYEVRRRRAEMRDFLGLDEAERLVRLEVVLHDERAAGEQRLKHIEEPPIQADGQKSHEDAFHPDPMQLVEEDDGGVGRVVQMQNRLWIARGSRGEGGCGRAHSDAAGCARSATSSIAMASGASSKRLRST